MACFTYSDTDENGASSDGGGGGGGEATVVKTATCEGKTGSEGDREPNEARRGECRQNEERFTGTRREKLVSADTDKESV